MSDTTKLITLDNLKSFATQVDATFMRKGDMDAYVIDADKANELIDEKLKGFSTTDELVKQVDAQEGTYSLLLTGADLTDSGVGNVQKDDSLTFNVADNTLSTTNVKASNLLSGETNVIEIIESTTEFIPDEGVSTVDKLGGIAANTSSDELSGKTINELLNLMLFPEVNGNATKPSVTIGKTTNFNGVLEKGIAGPTLSDFTTTFNDGDLSYAVGDDGVVVKNAANTSGVISSGITCGSEEVTDAATPSTLVADSYTYKLTVNAGSAELSLATNKGKAISGAFAGGNLTASTTISLAYPIYYGLVTASPETITSGDITSLTSEVTNSYDAKTLRGNDTTCRFCFAVDNNRTYKKFVDSNTFDVTANYTKVTVKVKTQYNLEVDYNVYMSNEQSTDDAYSVTAYK